MKNVRRSESTSSMLEQAREREDLHRNRSTCKQTLRRLQELEQKIHLIRPTDCVNVVADIESNDNVIVEKFKQLLRNFSNKFTKLVEFYSSFIEFVHSHYIDNYSTSN